MFVKMEKSVECMCLIDKQYHYLESCLNNKGQLVDKKLKSPLNFQYHYSSFILSSILINKTSDIGKVIDYYLSVDKTLMKPSNDFNVMLLSFAVIFDKNDILDKEKILKSFYHHSNKELYKLNNNFRALRVVGMILDKKLSNKDLKDKISDEIDWLLDLQFDDGFFPDSNMKYKVEKNQGVPHLTYHTKIMMCVGLAYLYTKDERLKEAFFKSIKVLLEISIDNYYFFYGRSTNALFGYGSLYVVFILAYKFSSDKLFLNKANSMIDFLKAYQHNDGHISINLNKNDKNRIGFDTYMYDIVYNAYSNALFLLGNKFLEELKFEHYNFISDSFKMKIYEESGFVVYNNENIKYCFNYKGHQNSLKHKFDSRVSPFSLLYFYKNNKNILSAVGYQPQSILRMVEKKFPLRILYGRLYRYFYFDWIPLFGGNSFYYLRDGIKFYPFRFIKKIKLKNKIIMKFLSKSRKIFFDDIENDYFVISIDIKKELEYNLFFYKSVDKLYYICQNNDFLKYNFNKDYKEMKYLDIETSCGKSKLKSYAFKNIKNLKIKVNNI